MVSEGVRVIWVRETSHRISGINVNGCLQNHQHVHHDREQRSFIPEEDAVEHLQQVVSAVIAAYATDLGDHVV